MLICGLLDFHPFLPMLTVFVDSLFLSSSLFFLFPFFSFSFFDININIIIIIMCESLSYKENDHNGHNHNYDDYPKINNNNKIIIFIIPVHM